MSPCITPTLSAALLALLPLLCAHAAAQQIKIVPPGSGAPGGSVAADGSHVVMAAGEGGQGMPAVFQRSGNAWNYAGQLAGPPATASTFGWCVALAGGTVAVGSPDSSPAAPQAGAVTLFDVATLTYLHTLTAPDAQIGDRFGWSLAMQGPFLVVGAPLAETPTTDSGAAYVYRNDIGNWALEAKLIPPALSPLSIAGTSVAVSGNFVAIGSPGAPSPPGGTVSGRADIWERTGTYPFVSWEHRYTVGYPFYDPGAYFGGAIALGDGILAVGARGADDAVFINSGLAFIYEATSASSWTLVQSVRAPDYSQHDLFGFSVALSGTVLWVGAPQKNFAGTPVGAAYVFATSALSPEWHTIQKVLPFDTPSSAQFGRAIAFAGSEAVTGAPGSTPMGGAYVIQALPLPTAYCQSKLNSQGCTPIVHYSGSPTLSGPDDFVIGASAILSHTNGILFWGTAPNTTPFAGGTLCVTPPLRRTTIQNAGGTPLTTNCSGTFSFHFSQGYIAANGLVPGTRVYAQFYSRDNGFPMPNNVGLTNGLTFTILP